MRKVLASLAALALVACAQQPSPSAPPNPGAPQTIDQANAQDACGASAFAHLVGAPASAIDRTRLPQQTRILAPDTPVTDDFHPQRLNILVGADGTVTSLACY
jgi:hypothetical protein